MEREQVVASTTPLSKLRPPHVRHTEITRHRLIDDERLATREVVTFCAPAGYGKSTLAIQWASRSARPVAWVTLDESDNDPVVLVNTLSAALAHAVTGFVPVTQVAGDEPTFTHDVLPSFACAVSGLDSPVTVVFDDVHILDSSATTRVIKTLVDALPIGSQVAFAGRSMSVVPLPLWRGQGRTWELYADDLRFSASETAAAVAGFGRKDPGGQDIHEASAGWPVAVFLLSQASSVRSLTNVEEFIEAEVLAPMAAEVRDFVMCTAALGTVNVDLATAVTGSPTAARFLSEAITTVLIAPGEHGWYRYHPLMQDAVLDLWRRTDPYRLAQLQAAAATWYLGQGLLDTAVSYAISSGDGPTLGHVVWAAGQVALLQGRTQTVLGWLNRISSATIDAEPELSMTAVWANVVAGDYGNVLRHAEQTQFLMPGDWMEHPADFSIGAHLALFMATSHAGVTGPVQALKLAEVARDCVDPTDPLMPLCTLILGLNQALTWQPQARQTLQESEALALATAAAPSTRVEALCMLGLLLLVQGDEQAGCASIDDARTQFTINDLGQMGTTTGVLLLAEVALACHRGGPAEIRQAIDRQQTVGAQIAPILQWYRSLSGGVLAFASVRIRDHDAYHDYVTWCQGDGLCRQWAVKAQLQFAAETPLTQLTPAELRVWELLKSRMTLNEIAGSLYLSRETVKSHTGSIYRKLGVSSRREAQDLADNWG